MGSKRIRKNGMVELCIKHRLLPRPAYFTFDTLELADAYESQLQRLFAAGHVPPELLQPDSPVQPLLAHVIRDYLNHASPKASAADVLDLVREDANVATLPMDRLTFRWVKGFKMDQGLAPGTIRKRVGALALRRADPARCRFRLPATRQAPASLRLARRAWTWPGSPEHAGTVI